MDMGIPRNEYPRPQMRRENWINLNGIWEFAFDFGRTGKERGMQNASKLSREILYPSARKVCFPAFTTRIL